MFSSAGIFRETNHVLHTRIQIDGRLAAHRIMAILFSVDLDRRLSIVISLRFRSILPVTGDSMGWLENLNRKASLLNGKNHGFWLRCSLESQSIELVTVQLIFQRIFYHITPYSSKLRHLCEAARLGLLRQSADGHELVDGPTGQHHHGQSHHHLGEPVFGGTNVYTVYTYRHVQHVHAHNMYICI